jgi:malonate-semialdehyde dehydrogenase (acetylating)/methylmalonate-semialdehyde dehydrogenase
LSNIFSDRHTQSYDPATNKKIGSSPLHSPDDLQSAINSSRKAQKIWSGFTLEKRIEKIIRIKVHLVENLDELARTIAMENGKT